ncbi:sigma-54-dependent Fis family transcriptional regulator [Streptomyces tanashiensis]|uniref:sigma-54-dependent Fis family transcriptional regulator n=1 Tax=Streptomyces tanashiensis TaxID=67367 RepID=UPI0036E01488
MHATQLVGSPTKNRPNHTPRPEIELAWHRARMSGLDPGMPVRESVCDDIDRRSRLAVAAAPVLDRLAQDLADTRFTVLLADRDSVIVDWRRARQSLTPLLERVKAVPGSRYLESVAGSNALATAFELRQPIAVTGEEHFLEALRDFACYGAPVLHPVTRRLEGVLDITGHVDDTSVLMEPLVRGAVRDIRQNLLDGARRNERRVLDMFHERAARRAHPVIVLGAGMLLANEHASGVLDADTQATLRALAAEASHDLSHTTGIVLASGRMATVHVQRVDDSTDGVVFEFEMPISGESSHGRETAVRRRSPRGTSRPEATPVPGEPVLVHGEAGSGRTTAARRLASSVLGAGQAEDVRMVSAIDDASLDLENASAEDWLRRARTALESSAAVVVDDVHLLSERSALGLAQLLAHARDVVVVLTSSPVGELTGACHGLSVRCPRHVELSPLHRRDDFADVVRVMLGDICGPGRRVSPNALSTLAAQPWPGNLRELNDVLRQAAASMSSGDITVRDLPPMYRTSPARRRLSLLEQAEHDAIVAALAACGGNKSRAAARLGIGRNTLYERIRRLGIPS